MKIRPLIFFALISFNSYAQLISSVGNLTGGSPNTIQTAVPFLLITPDARAGGLGDAGCASFPDAVSYHWNAAKYAFIKKEAGIAVSYTPWLRALVPDINLADVSIYIKIKKYGFFGVSTRYFSFGDITLTSPGGLTIGQFRQNEHSESIFYAAKLGEHFSGGGAIKYIYSNANMQSYPGWCVAADMSCFWTDMFTLKDIPSKLSFGVNISNIGGKIPDSSGGEKKFIPQNLRAGISYKAEIDSHNSIEVICDANKLLVPLPAVNGSISEHLRTINIASGLEYWYAAQYALRSGFFYEDWKYGGRKYFTFGLGVHYAVFGLDFAYLVPTEQRHPLQNTLRFTMSFDFEKFLEKKKKEPQNFLG